MGRDPFISTGDPITIKIHQRGKGSGVAPNLLPGILHAEERTDQCRIWGRDPHPFVSCGTSGDEYDDPVLHVKNTSIW